MARVGKYQALGRSLGQYKKTLYDVGAQEYQKKARAAEGEFERGMYSAVGTTIANLAGIAQERAELKKLQPLDPGERPEVPIEAETIDDLTFKDVEDEYGEDNVYKKAVKGVGGKQEFVPQLKMGELNLLGEEEFKPFPQPSPAPSPKPKISIEDLESGTQANTIMNKLIEDSAEEVKIGELSFPNPTNPAPGKEVIKEVPDSYDWLGTVKKATPEQKEAAMLRETEALAKQWDAEDKAMFGALKEEDNFNVMGTNGDWGEGTNGGYDNPQDIQANMSALEKRIAIAENAPFFESLGKEKSATFEDVHARGETDLSKAEKRPASGFGTLARKGEKQIDFKTAVSRMRDNINEARSSLKKEFKGFEQFTPSQQDSLIEMVYQMGFYKVKSKFPTMIKMIKAGRWDDAQKEALYKDRTDLNRGESAWALQTPNRAKRVAKGFIG